MRGFTNPYFKKWSFVDSLTNDSNLHLFGEDEIIRTIKNYKFPQELLSVFLHEYTHHWSFNSIVGDVLSFLEIDVMMNQYRFVHIYKKEKDHKKIISEYLPLIKDINRTYSRLEFAKGLLNPFFEGIALFAEHEVDIVSKKKYSPPFKWAKHLFSQRYSLGLIGFFFGLIGADVNLSTYLKDTKFLNVNLERRNNLLLSSYDEAYLSGYLFVRSIYMHGVNNKYFRPHGENFIFFLKSFILDSPTLANILHDNTKEFAEFAKLFTEELMSRIEILFSPEVEKYFDFKDENLWKVTKNGWHFCKGLENSESRRKIEETLSSRYAYFGLNYLGLIQDSKRHEELWVGDQICSSSLKNRAYFRLATCETEIQITSSEKGGFEIKTDIFGFFLGRKNNDEEHYLESGKHKGIVDVYLDSNKNQILYVLSGQFKTLLVLSKKFRSKKLQEREDLKGTFTNRNQKEMVRDFRNTASLYGDYGIETNSNSVKHVVNLSKKLIYKLRYNPFSCFELPKDRLNKFAEGIEDNGIYDIFKDIELVKGIAILEACSTGIEDDFKRELFLEHKINYDEITEVLKNFKERYI